MSNKGIWLQHLNCKNITRHRAHSIEYCCCENGDCMLIAGEMKFQTSFFYKCSLKNSNKITEDAWEDCCPSSKQYFGYKYD